jgi:hypothetical protein
MIRLELGPDYRIAPMANFYADKARLVEAAVS